jgi:alpha-tubulin suppressor-like RCC1 family protein
VVVSMPAGVTVSALAAGSFHSLALDTKGHGWGWGFNTDGQLGNGTTINSTTPVAVIMPSGVAFSALSCGGRHSLALDTSGHAWAWGFNADGELGNGTTGTSTTPVAVSMPTGSSFKAIAAGGDGQSLALDTSGTAWGWGYNGDDELGNGTTSNSTTPVKVTMPSGVAFRSITTGGDHSLALDATGRAWGWGHNVYGQLGNGTTRTSSTPLAVHMPSGVAFIAIAAGVFHSLAIDTTGHIWSWGSNGHGQLGNGSTTNSATPLAVTMPAGVTLRAVAAGADFSLVLDKSGNAWAWGYNGEGELGDGKTASTTSPVAVSMPPGVTFSAIAADGTDSDHSLALDAPPLAAQIPELPVPLLLVAVGAAAASLVLGGLRRSRGSRKEAR